MRLWLAFFPFFVLSQAHATSPYQRYTNALGKQAEAAAVLHFAPENGEVCTGFFVGPNGEALTALHCVEDCLANAKAIDDKVISTLTERLIKLPEGGVNCHAQVWIGKLEVASSIVIQHVFGPGFLSPRESLGTFSEQSPSDYNRLLKEGFEGWGDLALIKLSVKSTCATVEAADLHAAQAVPVFNLSHPMIFRAVDDHSSYEPVVFMSLGEIMMYTDGEASSNPEIYSKAGLSPQDLAYMQTYMAPGTFLTSVDSAGGASGSPIFNSAGRVIGILRSTFNADSAEYRPWTAEGIDLSLHIDEIRRLVPENLNCSDGVSEN